MPVSETSDHTGKAADLQLGGPRVAIEIGVPTVLAELLVRRGLPVPPARRGFGLVDTGASITAVDEGVVASLGIQPIGQMKLSTPTRSMSSWLYVARLTCDSGEAMADFEILDVVGCTLQPQGFIALLGRNFLRNVVLVYDGAAGIFTLQGRRP